MAKLKVALIFAVCLLATAETAHSQWLENLVAARKARTLNKWQTANALFDKARNQARNADPAPSVVQMEEVMWERAETLDAYAHTLKGPTSRRECALKAAELWKDYIDWYSSLSENETNALGDPRRSDSKHRICKAVELMGQLWMRAGAKDRLVQEYEGLKLVVYANPGAIQLWKNCLYDDGFMSGRERSPEDRSRSISQRPENWRSYQKFLEQWADSFYLSEVARDKYVREAVQIKRELD
jgi:hypothetical protein